LGVGDRTAVTREMRHFLLLDDISGGSLLADTNVATSTDFADPDPIDVDRLAASLDHLRAHFCQGARNDAVPSSSDRRERGACADHDPHRSDLNQPVASVHSAPPSVAA
jgi:hypothetical protein